MIMVRDEAELVDCVRGAQGRLSLCGGATRGLVEGADALSLGGLSGITLYEPGSLTMVAGAGTPVAEVEAALAEQNQRLAFEPMDHRGLLGTNGEPTIGGVFAANVSGPRRMVVGAARDFLLGVRFVDGRGKVVSNGGRVMKNVTGYDLVKLMAGSFGALGALSEVSFKVLPKPETEATLVLHGLSDREAIAALALAMRSPFEVLGAAHVPQEGITLLRLEGFEASVGYRLSRLKELLAAQAGEVEVLGAAGSAARWQAVRDVDAFHRAGGDVWRIACKPSQAPDLAEAAKADAHLFDWAGGLLWCRVGAGFDLRARLGTFDGHATITRAAAKTLKQLGRFHPQQTGVARLTAGLRDRFDPRGIFHSEIGGLHAG